MVKTLQEVLEDDLESQIADGELDDAVWLDLSKEITVPSELQRFELPVTVYFASRLLQWEVGNGGYAQAAINVPEWFELAALGYRKLN
jgi:hypothetical protein